MSKFFDVENQPIVTKLTIKCPKCGEKNDVWLGFAIVGKNKTNSQPKQRTWGKEQRLKNLFMSIK